MTFGQGSGPIFVDNADCVGDELGLINCPYDAHTGDCTHVEDAGVRCNGRRKSAVVFYFIIIDIICSNSFV